jgi:hypothetical protein
LIFESITDRHELLLVDDIFAPGLEVVFVQLGLDDRIDRAAFLAKTAVDALEQIDVIGVVRREPSARCSESMVMASAGHTASHSLQAMQRSSPFG